jgi:transposase
LRLVVVEKRMRRILRADFEQVHLLPPSVEEWVGARHPARFIREFVESVELNQLGIVQPNAEEGGECYASELLLSVWLYGYWRKVRATRKLEDACANDLGFIWLSGNHRPDHHALWRFWDANKTVLRRLFKHTVAVAMKLELVEMVTQVIDGTKILAACSQWGRHDREHNAQLIEKLEKFIDELEKEIASAPAEESRRAELDASLGQRQALREKVRAALEQIESGQTRYAHPQESEARRMKTPGRNRFAYNAQVVVDAAQSVITAVEVVSEANDERQLWPMMQAAEETTGQVAQQTLADCGYSTPAQLAAAAEHSTSTVYVPLPRNVQNQDQRPYHCSEFQWDAQRDVVICPQGRELKFHHQRRRSGQTIRLYRDIKACADCPVRAQCTRDRHGRSIEIGPHWHRVNAHREHMAREHSRKVFKQRGAIVERVFGHIKAHWGFNRWSAKGLANVRAQWDLLCSTWNLTRMFTRWQQSPGLFATVSMAR